MSAHPGHFIEVYECGHHGSQCRCPGPGKEVRPIKGLCPACVRVAREEDGRVDEGHPDAPGHKFTEEGEPKVRAVIMVCQGSCKQEWGWDLGPGNPMPEDPRCSNCDGPLELKAPNIGPEPDYEQMLEDAEDRLIIALYLLMRDHVPTGKVASVIQAVNELEIANKVPGFSAPELRALAERYARSIMDAS